MIRKAKRARQAASWLAMLVVSSVGIGQTPASGTMAPVPPDPVPQVADARLESVMGGTADGYRLADRPRRFSFPDDHGPHPGFRTEWWYVTGHLRDEAGDWFGVQLTFFRFALTPQRPAGGSAWRARDAWMAHMAVTDERAGAFHADERFARGVLGLAGARAAPFGVWLEDWQLVADEALATQWHASAASGEVALALTLDASAPPVLNGVQGLSAKGSQPGNASYYYSMPRMVTHGRLRTPRGQHQVSGALWLDREWSTSALEPGVVGWDWFALQLDDGRDLMLYQLRRADGSAHPASAGTRTLPGADRAAPREAQHLAGRDLAIEVLDHWVSPATGKRYPARWRIHVAGEPTALTLLPTVAAQEHTGLFDYWEGAVRVADPSGRVVGRGYVEMTGYPVVSGTVDGVRPH